MPQIYQLIIFDFDDKINILNKKIFVEMLENVEKLEDLGVH